MNMVVVCVRDLVADVYLPPAFVHSRGAAVRSFGDEVNKKDSPLNSHPEDYELLCLGEWNDKTGLFQTGVPESIALGKHVIVRE